MPTVRMLDTGLVEALRAGEVPVEIFPALGLEAALAGLAAPLDEGDVLAGSVRDLASWPAGGVALDDAVGGMFGGAPSPADAGRSCRAGTPYPG
jgi:TPP-dependent pyruvate/acetoin dehydrogenase alpha subunit